MNGPAPAAASRRLRRSFSRSLLNVRQTGRRLSRDKWRRHAKKASPSGLLVVTLPMSAVANP